MLYWNTVGDLLKENLLILMSALICQNFTEFSEADLEPDPICLRGKHWEFIKEDIEETVANR